MKAIYLRTAAAIAVTGAVAACIPRAEAPPRPAPPPVATTIEPPPAPSAPMQAMPRFDNYLDAPQTPGTWTYTAIPAGSMASFGVGPGISELMLRCDKGTRTIDIVRPTRFSAGPDYTMQVQTETTVRELQAQRPSGKRVASAELPAGDPLLDAMAITKGRFALKVDGEPTLYVPAWAEVTRVIEDCR